MTGVSDHRADHVACHELSHARVVMTKTASAPSILFVHGGFHGAWCWSGAMHFLSKHGIGSAAVDLRGHGGLRQDSTFITQGVRAMTQDVLEAAAILPQPVILVGHSLGALITMKAAAQMKPRGLMLLAPAAPAGVGSARPLPRFPSAAVVQPPPADRARKWFLSGHAAPDASDYLARLCPESPALLNECFHDRVAIAASDIFCDVVCLSGGKDDSPLHPAGQDEAVAAHLNAALRVIPQSGHCMMLDDGEAQTSTAILDFVRACG